MKTGKGNNKRNEKNGDETEENGKRGRKIVRT